MARKDKDEPVPLPPLKRYARIYDVVRQVPAGEVATYGQVALVAAVASARLVGRALAELPDGSGVPWHRVLNSQGRISPRKGGGPDPEQRRLLQAEGVYLDRHGRVDFSAVAWGGPAWAWLDAEGYDLEDLVMRSGQIRRQGPWCRWHF